MLWVLKRTVSMLLVQEPSQLDGSFELPKHMFTLMGKKLFTIFRSKSFYISGPMKAVDHLSTQAGL